MLRFFPYSRISQVPELEVKAALIQMFQIWEQPQSIRVDNGAPLGDPSRKSIPPLALWLTALGIEVIFNRPGRPTDNAQVERMQQTTKNWADIKQAPNLSHLKQRLNEALLIQRQCYKVRRLEGKTRLEAFPKLLDQHHKYHTSNFCVDRAYQKLAQWSFVRMVSKAGQFGLYNQRYYVGKTYSRQYMIIKFDPKQILWLVYDANGQFFDAFPAKKLEQHHILNLTVCQ